MKKFIAMMLVVMSLFVVAACGDDDKDTADTTKPVVTVNPDSLMTSFSVQESTCADYTAPDWTTYFTATDDVDGDLTIASADITSDVDWCTAGTYTVTASVKDAANNEETASVTITVTLTDDINPGLGGLGFTFENSDMAKFDGVDTITFDGEQKVTFVIVTFDETVLCTGDIYLVAYPTGTSDFENTTGTTFAKHTCDQNGATSFSFEVTVGANQDLVVSEFVYVIAADSVADTNGNTNDDIVMTVKIVEGDLTAPVITVNAELDTEFAVNATEPNWADYITVVDAKDTDLDATDAVIISTVDFTIAGDYTVTFTVTDASGNEAEEVLDITVYDVYTVTVDSSNSDLTAGVLELNVNDVVPTWEDFFTFTKNDAEVTDATCTITVDGADVAFSTDVAGSFIVTCTYEGETASITVNVSDVYEIEAEYETATFSSNDENTYTWTNFFTVIKNGQELEGTTCTIEFSKEEALVGASAEVDLDDKEVGTYTLVCTYVYDATNNLSVSATTVINLTEGDVFTVEYATDVEEAYEYDVNDTDFTAPTNWEDLFVLNKNNALYTEAACTISWADDKVLDIAVAGTYTVTCTYNYQDEYENDHTDSKSITYTISDVLTVEVDTDAVAALSDFTYESTTSGTWAEYFAGFFTTYTNGIEDGTLACTVNIGGFSVTATDNTSIANTYTISCGEESFEVTVVDVETESYNSTAADALDDFTYESTTTGTWTEYFAGFFTTYTNGFADDSLACTVSLGGFSVAKDGSNSIANTYTISCGEASFTVKVVDVYDVVVVDSITNDAMTIYTDNTTVYTWANFFEVTVNGTVSASESCGVVVVKGGENGYNDLNDNVEGVYVVTCTSESDPGQSAYITVTVEDNTPVYTITVDTTTEVETGVTVQGNDTDGYTLELSYGTSFSNWESLFTITATYEGSTDCSITDGGFNANVAANYTVTCTAEDNATVKSITVTVAAQEDNYTIETTETDNTLTLAYGTDVASTDWTTYFVVKNNGSVDGSCTISGDTVDTSNATSYSVICTVVEDTNVSATLTVVVSAQEDTTAPLLVDQTYTYSTKTLVVEFDEAVVSYYESTSAVLDFTGITFTDLDEANTTVSVNVDSEGLNDGNTHYVYFKDAAGNITLAVTFMIAEL